MASKRILNWLLDIICVACVGFVGWHAWDYYIRPSPRPGDPTGMVGFRLKLRDVTWSDSPRTVVLALSGQCRFCKMSAEFYRALVDSARPDRFRVVAAVKKSADDSEPNLAELGIEKARDIREADLAGLGVRHTPTVMVVNRRGVVEAAWVGKLSASQEAEVFRAVKVEAPPRSNTAASLEDESTRPVQAAELRALLKDPNTVVLDTRERTRFYEAHIPGSLNMPIDEIDPRAPHELPTDRTILMYCLEYIYCRAQGSTSSEVRMRQFSAFACEASRRALEEAGVTKVRCIADDLATLKRAGVPVDGKPHP